jgi:hypothetical protein
MAACGGGAGGRGKRRLRAQRLAAIMHAGPCVGMRGEQSGGQVGAPAPCQPVGKPRSGWAHLPGGSTAAPPLLCLQVPLPCNLLSRVPQLMPKLAPPVMLPAPPLVDMMAANATGAPPSPPLPSPPREGWGGSPCRHQLRLTLGRSSGYLAGCMRTAGMCVLQQWLADTGHEPQAAAACFGHACACSCACTDVWCQATADRAGPGCAFAAAGNETEAATSSAGAALPLMGSLAAAAVVAALL